MQEAVLRFIQNQVSGIHDDVAAMFVKRRVSRRQYSRVARSLHVLATELGTFVELQKQHANHDEQQTKLSEENTALRVKAHMWDELAHRIKVGLGALVQKAAQSNYPEDAVRLNAKLSGLKLVQDWMQDMERSMGGGLDS